MAATSGDDDESIEEHKQALIHPAAMLYGVQKMFGDQARVKAKQAYGGVRHGVDLRDGLALHINEARLYCNLIRSYITFLIGEHERLSGRSS